MLYRARSPLPGQASELLQRDQKSHPTSRQSPLESSKVSPFPCRRVRCSITAASPPPSPLRDPAMPPGTRRAQETSHKCPQNCFVQQLLAYPCRKNDVPMTLKATWNCWCRTRRQIHKAPSLVRLGAGGHRPISGWLSRGSCCTGTPARDAPRSEGCSPTVLPSKLPAKPPKRYCKHKPVSI